MGYSSTQKGYKVYHPITRKYLVYKDVVFDETTFYYQSTTKKELRELPYLTVPDKTIIHENETQNDNGPIHTPQLQLLGDNSPPKTSYTVPEGVNLEIEAGNQGTIVTYPKYYERRRRERPLELEVNQNNQEPILEDVRESISDEGGAEWPISLRKGKRSSVKTLP